MNEFWCLWFNCFSNRPLMVSTEEYGKLWLSFSNDVKQNLKLLTGAGGPLITTLDALQESLRLHTVHVIGKMSSVRFIRLTWRLALWLVSSVLAVLHSSSCICRFRGHRGVPSAERRPLPDALPCPRCLPGRTAAFSSACFPRLPPLSLPESPARSLSFSNSVHQPSTETSCNLSANSGWLRIMNDPPDEN